MGVANFRALQWEALYLKQYPGYEIERFENEGGCCGDECTKCVHIVEDINTKPGAISSDRQQALHQSGGIEETEARQSQGEIS